MNNRYKYNILYILYLQVFTDIYKTTDIYKMTMNTRTIETTQQFYDILKENNSIAIFKFGADWCSPCKKIESTVSQWFEHLSNTTTIQTVYVDVDEAFDLYSHLKTKKMIKGIPAILAYYKGNESYVFNDSVVGSDIHAINLFFERCIQNSSNSQSA